MQRTTTLNGETEKTTPQGTPDERETEARRSEGLYSIRRILGEPTKVDVDRPLTEHCTVGVLRDVLTYRTPGRGATFASLSIALPRRESHPNASECLHELMVTLPEEQSHCSDTVPLICHFLSIQPLHGLHGDLRHGASMALSHEWLPGLPAVMLAHPAGGPLEWTGRGGTHKLWSCVWLTWEEMAFATRHGHERLLDALALHRVWPYTIPGRESVMLKW